MIPASLLLAHAFATAVMAGVIWFVQIVHYPLMARVPEPAFAPYAFEHQRRTTLIVAPAMLVEASTGVWIALLSPTALPLAGLGLLAIVWASTFAVQVPLHTRLAAHRDDRTLRLLVATNWLRTFAWTARLIIALALLTPR